MNRLLLLSIAILSFATISAQDPAFSQFYGSPLTLNPALTGAFDGSYRVGVIYRDQWRSVLDNPYQTYSAAVDLRFGIDQYSRGKTKDYAAFGLMFFGDKVSGVDFSTNQMSLNAAYHKSLNPRNTQFLSLGFQGSISQRNLNYEGLYFSDQFNGINAYVGQIREDLPGNNFSFADFSVGLNYSSSPRKRTGLFLGVAMHHFLSPSISFYDPELDETPETMLYPKYSAQFSLQVPMGERIQFLPRALAALQGPHFVANAGASFRFQLGNSGATALHLGSWLRPVTDTDSGFHLDAVVGMAGIEYSNFLFGFSYDAYLTDLSNARQGQGALEFSVIYLGDYDNDTVLCPKF